MKGICYNTDQLCDDERCYCEEEKPAVLDEMHMDEDVETSQELPDEDNRVDDAE